VEVKVVPRFVHIVEDNATFRKTIEGRLKEFGYEVSTYPSAQHCWIARRATTCRAASSSTCGYRE
jgi:FixJ family two-component response regulator